jgi:hypothetical protein
MAQDLTVNIKTTSDVPQAMDKAKTATVGFGKQVEDIQRKFSTAFKDIFLSFLGPLALLGVALNYIGKLIEENQKKHADANQAAIDGTNDLMSAEDRYWARKMDREKKTKESQEQAVTSREDITRSFLENDPRGQSIAAKRQRLSPIGLGSNYAKSLAMSKEVQNEVQKILAEDMKKNPDKGALPSDKKADSNFKGPEGFGNVIGVGPNPVMEAMARQIEIQEQQLAELKKISGTDNAVPTDFTKTPSK